MFIAVRALDTGGKSPTVNNLPRLPGTFLVFTLKVPCLRNSLDSGKTGTTGCLTISNPCHCFEVHKVS